MSYNPAPAFEDTIVRVVPGNNEVIADRIISLEILDPRTGKYLPFDLSKSYTIAASDYLLGGGDNYVSFGAVSPLSPPTQLVFPLWLPHHNRVSLLLKFGSEKLAAS
jgi:hypothetical protein